MLKDKVVIVTGGAGLLGKEFIKAVVQNNGIGIIADIDPSAGKKVSQEICREKPTAKVDFVELDITSKDSIQKMINTLVKKYDRIDALVNNAYPRNKNYGRKFEEVTYEDFCENVDLHLGGYFLVSQQLAEYFKQQGQGNIVNISSIYGVTAPRFDVYENTPMTMPVEYAAIKAALVHLTKYIAKYYRGKNIRVNAISSGGILAGQPESFVKKYKTYCLNKGMLENQDLKGTLVYLLSDLSKFVNGQNIIVDDGFTL